MKEIVTYKEGKFTDFEGKERNVIMCAISSTNASDVEIEDIYDDGDVVHIDEIAKTLRIGYSVCTPPDEFELELGKKKAYGCAKSKRGHAVYATHAGIINTNTVEAILTSELNFLCEHPECVILGYAERKKKYEQFVKDIQTIKSADDNINKVLDFSEEVIKKALEIKALKKKYKISKDYINEL